jgi:hypothetical protein
MCEFQTQEAMIAPVATSTFKAMCKSENAVCRHYESCAYIGQFTDKEPRVWVLTHRRLTTGEPADLALPDAAAIIVDESIIETMTRTIHAPIESFSLSEVYSGGPDALRQRNCAVLHVEVGTRIARAIERAGADGRNAVRFAWEEMASFASDVDTRGMNDREAEFARAKHIRGLVRSAADAAAETARRNGGLYPAVIEIEDTVQKRTEWLRKFQPKGVAHVLRQVYMSMDPLRRGAGSTIALGFQGSSVVNGETVGPYALHHGRDPAVMKKSTPLLLLDADGIESVNAILFNRSFRVVIAEGRRLAHVIQVNDSAFAKSTLLPDAKKPRDWARRGKDRLRSALELAKGLHAAGEKVVIFTNKPIHVALRKIAGIGSKHEESDDLGSFTVIERGLEIAHFGNYTGIDRWKTFTVAIVLGREEPPAVAMETLFRRIYADQYQPAELGRDYVEAVRPYGPGHEKVARLRAHSVPAVQQLVELKRERMSAQGVDRLRLMRWDERHANGKMPLVVLLCDIPLPGIVPDKLATASEILAGGSRIERALKSGFLSTNAAAMVKAHPGLWESEKAAEHELLRARVAQSLEYVHQEKVEDAKSLKNQKTPKMQDIEYLQNGGFVENQGLRGTDFSYPSAIRGFTLGWFRAVGTAKWSAIAIDPSTPQGRRPDIIVAKALSASHLDGVEFRGDAAETVRYYRTRTEGLSDILASLTVVDGPPPSAESTARFIATYLELSEAVDLYEDAEANGVRMPDLRF